ncbi:MAG: flagellar hook-basal body complex protein FliE [Clostridiales bacterium]|nr:MAG: flagellar hook-basal body complex protein FliE [Clostridiales bacterium]
MKIDRVFMPAQLNNQNPIDAKRVKAVDFGKILNDAVTSLDQSQKIAAQYDQKVATGEIDNLHDAMIAAQKAEITLNFALQIRKSVLEAYQELMRLQI